MPAAKRPRGDSEELARATSALALTQLHAGPDSSQLLEQLTEVVQTLVLPHLGLAGVQLFEQVCTATYAIIASLSNVHLLQLAQVRCCCVQHSPRARCRVTRCDADRAPPGR